jgi:transcriptional regulator with XRE-family HTH domain
VRRRELAAFLRSRRERISPEQVGIAPGSRRRTPGLRREEVAQLAGVGVTWYTWLEQGRPINVSEQVLDAIARTLMLDPYERTHLFTLAGERVRTVEHECRALPPKIESILAKLEPFPACAQNARYDILAFNATYGRLVVDLTTMPFEDRNTLWLAFTDRRWREAMVDWEDATARMVAQYRAAMADHIAEPAWKALVRRLQHASPAFRDLWTRHDVLPVENRTKQLLNREVGLLRLDYTNLWFDQHRQTRLVTYVPHDAETQERLVRLQRGLAAAG